MIERACRDAAKCTGAESPSRVYYVRLTGVEVRKYPFAERGKHGDAAPTASRRVAQHTPTEK